jgi:predicted RNA-binding protein YlxR (DUF448 family)
LKQRKMPERMCVACRERKQKREMIRVVRNMDGTLSVDDTGKAPGRGAYICPTLDCLERAKKTNAIGRAIECSVTEEAYEGLKRAILRREITR